MAAPSQRVSLFSGFLFNDFCVAHSLADARGGRVLRKSGRGGKSGSGASRRQQRRTDRCIARGRLERRGDDSKKRTSIWSASAFGRNGSNSTRCSAIPRPAANAWYSTDPRAGSQNLSTRRTIPKRWRRLSRATVGCWPFPWPTRASKSGTWKH